jgi:hypothetical protein
MGSVNIPPTNPVANIFPQNQDSQNNDSDIASDMSNRLKGGLDKSGSAKFKLQQSVDENTQALFDLLTPKNTNIIV